jgi:hypothetical protein
VQYSVIILSHSLALKFDLTLLRLISESAISNRMNAIAAIIVNTPTCVFAAQWSEGDMLF